MVTVFLTGREVLDAEINYEPIEFPESPKIGDYIQLDNFKQTGESKSLSTFLEERNKISLGRVDGRSWQVYEGKMTLFLTLDFEDKKSADNSADGYFK